MSFYLATNQLIYNSFYETECCKERNFQKGNGYVNWFTSKEKNFVARNPRGSFLIMQWMWSCNLFNRANYDDSMPTFLLGWSLFPACSYIDRLVVIVLRELHIHSRLGSSNLSFACDLTLASQLINLVPLFRACSSNLWCNKPYC